MPETPAACPPADTEQATTPRYLDFILVALLVGVALAYRFWLIPSFHVISVDGTGFADAARRLTNGDHSLLARYGFYPILVAGAHLLISNLELAGRLVAAIMGGLLIVPVYALGKVFFSRPVAICAGLLIIGWPEMVVWSCEVMSQSTFMTLTMTGILLVWRGYDHKSSGTMLLAGVVLGLAYATRTEALVLLGALLAAPVAAQIREDSPERRRAAKLLLPYLAGFLLILIPNLLLVHEATGTWQLAVKTSGALRDGLLYYLKMAEYEMPPELNHIGYWDILRSYPGFIPYSIMKNLGDSLRMMLPPLLWIVAVLGFLAGGWSRGALLSRLFLLSSFAPYGVIIVFYYVGPEYYQPYLPVLLLWVGQGLVSGTDYLAATAIGVRYRRILAAAPLPLLIAGTLTANTMYTKLTSKVEVVTHSTPKKPLDGRLVQKELGIMADRFLPPGKIMTRWARTGFYANREWAIIPAAGTIDDLLSTARREQVRFLIADPMALNNCPQLALLYEPAGVLVRMERPLEPQVKYVATYKVEPHPGFLLHMLYRDHKMVTAAVYEILPEAVQ